jgi:hypothetical protein
LCGGKYSWCFDIFLIVLAFLKFIIIIDVINTGDLKVFTVSL